MIRNVIVLGGGSAGFLAAITLKTKLPALDIRVIRSPDIGIIGVGEGSTQTLTSVLHKYLKVPQKQFFDTVRPTFKLGLRFLWGPRPYFNYPFGPTLEQRVDERLPHGAGFYADEDLQYELPASAMMTLDRAFERTPQGPRFPRDFAYHFENERLVRFLEMHAAALGVAIVDDTVAEVRQNERGVSGLRLTGDGRGQAADLYVDCSGFRSVLLGRALAEPFIEFKSSLFCDRAVLGGWDRRDAADQVIKPYTTCETMNAGWCWQIEHETRINRGYVYSSAHISDEQAETEFRQCNPKVAAGATRVVRFISGRYRTLWVKNVVAMGNASGFVEPLEATALGVIALQARDLTQTLIESDGRPRPTQVSAFNMVNGRRWEEIRRFIAVHYKFNTRLDTPFWRDCREQTDLAGAEEIIQYYRENGPAPYWGPAMFDANGQFGFGGYATMLMGQRVPFDRSRNPTDAERTIWEGRRRLNKEAAGRAMTVREVLDRIHAPTWTWHAR